MAQHYQHSKELQQQKQEVASHDEPLLSPSSQIIPEREQIQAEAIYFENKNNPFIDNEQVSTPKQDEKHEDISVTEAISDEASEAISDEVSEAETEEVNEAISEELTEEVSEAITEEVSEKVSEAVTEEVSEAISEAISEEVTEEATEAISEEVTEEATEAISEEVTEEATEVISEAETEAISEAANETISEAATAAISEAANETSSEAATAAVSEAVYEKKSEVTYVSDLSPHQVQMQLLNRAFDAKLENNYNQAIHYFTEMLQVGISEQLFSFVGIELVNLYQTKGDYARARNIIAILFFDESVQANKEIYAELIKKDRELEQLMSSY